MRSPLRRRGRNDEPRGFTSSDGDDHRGRRGDQNGDGGREHGDGGCQGREQPVAASPKRPPVGRHGRHCGSRMHGMPSSTHTRRERMTGGSEPLDRWPYSAAAARNAAISMMKAVANQSSSGERNEVMGSRRGRFTKTQLNLSVASARSGSRFWPCREKKLRHGGRVSPGRGTGGGSSQPPVFTPPHPRSSPRGAPPDSKSAFTRVHSPSSRAMDGRERP